MREISEKYFNDSARTFCLSKEEINLLEKYSVEGGEPTGSMGDDTPLAPISEFVRSPYDHCRQKFAQVTNPPIDPIETHHSLNCFLKNFV